MCACARACVLTRVPPTIVVQTGRVCVCGGGGLSFGGGAVVEELEEEAKR
jgi:hypothetical protein